MNGVSISTNDEMVIKLLHYFITEEGYHPIILHGVKDEIWLENLDSDYKIIRIVSNYIHNDEQLNFDQFKTNQIIKTIKKKTFSHSMTTLNFFVNLGENVHLENDNCFYVKKNSDLKKYNMVIEAFPDIIDKLKFKESGINLFLKITDDINRASEEENKKAEDIFSPKKPYITYGLMLINVIVFIAMYLVGNGSEDSITLLNFGALHKYFVLNGEPYRLITCMFLHIGIIHLLFNMYVLYVIGAQIENFYGKVKYLIIYLVSGIIGGLFSCLLSDGVSAGASGAIFGLLGSLLYFGYHYRVYLGNVLKSQIIPMIVINLALGFILPGIDIYAHIGGLIGGVLISMALGVKYKSTTSNKVNGYILTSILVGFLLFLLLK